MGEAETKRAECGDPTQFNTDRTILDGVGRESLEQIAYDIIALLNTSMVVYEKNGDYAFFRLCSEWCTLLNSASCRQHGADDDLSASEGRAWLYHEECWEGAKAALEQGSPGDTPCMGIRLYSAPIFAGGEAIGAISVSYGAPSTDERTLAALAEKCGCDTADLREAAAKYEPLPGRLLEIAKKRVESVARQLGRAVEASRNVAMLRSVESRNRSLLAYSPVCHKIVDLDFKLQFMNVMGYKMLNLRESDGHYGKPYPFAFFPEEHRQQLLESLHRVRATGERTVLEGAACDSDGNAVWLFHNLIPVPDEEGKLDYITVVSVDITERKRAEKTIQKALDEKEVLLREVHHRVKNNMQVISGFIGMQSLKLTDPKMQQPLLELQNRIYAMSAVHEILHRGDSLSQIDLGAYVRKLTGTIFDAYERANGPRRRVEVEPVEISLEKSYPIGLVINELLSNSLKYAFPDDVEGEISVIVSLDAGSVVLCIADNGVGFPEGFDWKMCDSLGFVIVRSLVQHQLKGTIELEETGGISWRITFPVQ